MEMGGNQARNDEKRKLLLQILTCEDLPTGFARNTYETDPRPTANPGGIKLPFNLPTQPAANNPIFPVLPLPSPLSPIPLLRPHSFSSTSPPPITIPTRSLARSHYEEQADRSGRPVQIWCFQSRPSAPLDSSRGSLVWWGGGGGYEGAGRAEGAAGALVVEQAVGRRSRVPGDGAAPGVAGRLPGPLRVRVPGLHALLRAGRVVRRRRQAEGVGGGGQGRGVGGEERETRGRGRRRRHAGPGAAGVRVRRAGAVRGRGGQHVGEHAGGGRARHRGGAEAARQPLQPAGVRPRRGDAAVARAEPRWADRVPGREPVVRVPPGGPAPGAGGLRRGLHHHGPRVPGPPGGGPRGPRRRVPPRPEPPLLRLPPRHQRPPQPPLRRRLGRHPRRRPARVHGVVAGEDVGDLHGGGAGARPEGGGRGDGRAGARLRAGGGARVLPGVPVRGEPREGDQHAVARPLRHPRRQRRPTGGLLRRRRRHRHRRAVVDFSFFFFTATATP